MTGARLIVNGADLTSVTDGLGDIRVTFALNDSNRTVSFAASGVFEVHDQRFRELIENLSLAWPAELIINEQVTIPFEITARNVKDCGCTFDIVLQDITEDRIAYEKLARSLISDNDMIKRLVSMGASGKMNYCFEVDWIGYVLAYVYWTLYFVIQAIAKIIELFNDEPTAKAVTWYVVGCYKFHYPLRVHDVCEQWAQECGLTWQSSITSSPDHANLYIMDSFGHTGYSRRKPAPNNDRIQRDYIFNATIPQLLDQLSRVFNSDYRIINGVLVFERIDWFPANAARLDGYIDGDYCVNNKIEQLTTNINYRWAFDALDQASSKAGGIYGGRVDHNPNEWKSLRGTTDVSPRFAISGHNYDDFGDDDLRKYRWEFSKLDHIQFEHMPIIGAGQSSELRLFHLRKNSNGALNPIHTQVDVHDKSYPVFAYEETLAFKQTNRLSPFSGAKSLYNQYYYLEDARFYPRYSAQSITFVPTNICETIDLIRANNLNVYVDTPYGRALPGEIEYNPQTGVIVLQNCTIWP